MVHILKIEKKSFAGVASALAIHARGIFLECSGEMVCIYMFVCNMHNFFQRSRCM